MAGKYLLTTLGCKVNQYESQQAREVLESLGLRPADGSACADVAVVNTCAVTASASRKSRQMIRRLARGGKTAVIVLGCGASADAERLSRLKGVTAVIGHGGDTCATLRKLVARQMASPNRAANSDADNQETTRQRSDAGRNDECMIPMALAQSHQQAAPRRTDSSTTIIPPDSLNVKSDPAILGRISRFAGHQRAFLKVQDGCDAHCTYCTIPRLRPQLGSKPVDVAVAEARALVVAGHREIVITGIFLGAYGRETALRKRFKPGPAPLARLVDALARVDGLERLRLSSLEPGDVDESLLAVLTQHKNCTPHLHLPLQSGSPGVLRRMNRQYQVDAFINMVDRVRDALDAPAITTDIIVGFPGETNADFQASTDVAQYCGFAKIHAFPFSPRDHTAAARWQADFVEPPVVRERMKQMERIEQRTSLAYRRTLVGRTDRVLVEREVGAEEGSPDACVQLVGRSDRYFPIWFEGNDVLPGDLVTVRLDRVTPSRTHGSLISVPTRSRNLSLPILAGDN